MTIKEITICVKSENIEKLYFQIYKYEILGAEEISLNGNVSVKTYINKNIEDFCKDIVESGLALERLEIKDFDESINWTQNYKNDYQPFEIDKFTIFPPEYAIEKETSENSIIINQGQGFGTGRHESTQIALKLISFTLERERFDRFLDVGSGSGILSIAAFKLGQRKITGLEIDLDSINNARENAKLNKVDDIKFINSDIENFSEDKYDLICVNMIAERLIKFKQKIDSLISPSGTLILSGIYRKYLDDIKELYGKRYITSQLLEQGDWVGMILKKNSF